MLIGKHHQKLQLKLGNHVLEQVDECVYLGGTVTEEDA